MTYLLTYPIGKENKAKEAAWGSLEYRLNRPPSQGAMRDHERPISVIRDYCSTSLEVSLNPRSKKTLLMHRSEFWRFICRTMPSEYTRTGGPPAQRGGKSRTFSGRHAAGRVTVAAVACGMGVYRDASRAGVRKAFLVAPIPRSLIGVGVLWHPK